MATFTHPDDLTVAPMTADEKRWTNKMDALLKQMPERLYILECADGLSVVDRTAARNTEMHDGGARAAGIVLADFDHGLFKVTAVSG